MCVFFDRISYHTGPSSIISLVGEGGHEAIIYRLRELFPPRSRNSVCVVSVVTAPMRRWLPPFDLCGEHSAPSSIIVALSIPGAPFASRLAAISALSSPSSCLCTLHRRRAHDATGTKVWRDRALPEIGGQFEFDFTPHRGYYI